MAQIIAKYAKLGIAWGILIGLIVLYNNIGCRQVQGTEMSPTVPKDSFRTLYRDQRKPEEQINVDDIVSYEYIQAGVEQQTLVGRVAGLPGDTIEIRKGIVYRNGSTVDQSFVAPDNLSVDGMEELIVPRDSYFILMDNRRAAVIYDSRATGPIGIYAIGGKFKR